MAALLVRIAQPAALKLCDEIAGDTVNPGLDSEICGTYLSKIISKHATDPTLFDAVSPGPLASSDPDARSR